MLHAVIVALVLAFSVSAAEPEIDRVINDAIRAHNIPGAVYRLESPRRTYHRAYGNRALVPRAERMTESTLFDVASLTKVVATTPSIWLLIQRGQVELDAPLSRYIAEFRGGWRDEITIRHLLTHTSGLRPDLDLWSAAAKPPLSEYDVGISKACQEEPVNRPGYVFRYSDINFILLGEVVRRVSGEPLDVFAKREIFAPLRMTETTFRPKPSHRIAPTEFADGVMLRGVVHDPTARRMGGVAGHAGLFSTAGDLSRYARMLLRGGSPIFTRAIVAQMTGVQSPPNVANRRAGGFDLDTGFSRPRGTLFPIGSYGHTGFTGTILWIDPFSKSFYVFLSNRVHPNGKGVVTALQVALGTASARATGFDFSRVHGLPPRPGGEVGWITHGGDAANGIDALVAKRFAPLRGLRIGVITNQSGIDRAGNPTIDLLRSAPGVEVKAIFSPEHGLYGSADANVADIRYGDLPVYSLYGESRKPSAQQLAGLDALVFDIQDAGTRFYTYISTMGLAMEAAGAAHVKFIVLDRVNPIGGTAVEGPLLRGETNFVGWHSLPIRHGMTAGELAKMFREERKIDVDLIVIPIERWKREQWQDDAGLPWINPSPNLRSLTAAGLYPGIGILEQSISVGRGTATPFEIIGAPYIDADRFVRELPSLPGIRFEPAHFTPASSIFAGQRCSGARLVVTNRHALQPLATGIAIAIVLHRLYPNDFDLDACDRLLRDPRTLEAIQSGKTLDEVRGMWRQDEEEFRARRAKYLAYLPGFLTR